ncbi:MAG: hypothetical protein GWP91_09830, partial [Rhodobacterales bacterium]|nr:hypothetical protein [Rhodobacterales bacterium]
MNGYGFTAAALSAPGGALRQWRHDDGTEGWALVFEPPWNSHPLLQDGVAQIRDYLSSLGPGPLLTLSEFSSGTLYYASTGVPLSTLFGIAHGERAALELLGRAAQALLALDRGTLPSHGDLSPWRILVDSNGQVSILGLGVPGVSALAWLDEEVDTVETDAIRFFPPERLEDRGEDGRSDAYALGLCAAELALGVPVLSGN